MSMATLKFIKLVQCNKYQSLILYIFITDVNLKLCLIYPDEDPMLDRKASMFFVCLFVILYVFLFSTKK